MKTVVNRSMTVLIVVVVALFLYFLYFVNHDGTIKAVGTVAIALILLAWFFYIQKTKRIENSCTQGNIRKFVLVSRNGESNKEWHCAGTQSFLIGKGSGVDMDLEGSFYADYISHEHAVLNFANGCWYIEDLDSKNGVGIKKRHFDYSLKIKPSTSYKIDEGDIIYISKAKILVR